MHIRFWTLREKGPEVRKGLTFFCQFALFRLQEQSAELFHGVFVPLIVDFWHGIEGKREAALNTGKYDGKKGGSDSDGDRFRHCIYLDGFPK